MQTKAGIALMENALIGAGGLTLLTAGNARIGVGDGNGAPPVVADTDTDLAATTNRLFKGMAPGYPQQTGKTVVYQAVFGTAEANFVWREAGIDNGGGGTSTGGITVGAVLFDHLAIARGTKQAGAVWTYTLIQTQT